jgi:hypothetical protein
MLQQMLQAGISYSRLYNKIRQAQAAEAAYFSAISAVRECCKSSSVDKYFTNRRRTYDI